MNKGQRIHLMAELWPNACSAQGWNPADREKRLDILSEALGRPLASANDIDDHEEFSRVKLRLLRLADSLAASRTDAGVQTAAAAQLPPAPRGDHPLRIRREKILRQLKCLSLYLVGTSSTSSPSESYVRTLIRTTCSSAGYEPAAFAAAPFHHLLHHLSLRQLDRLVMTLDNRLHNKKTGMRVKAGHTLHDMNTSANLPCHCAACCGSTRRQVRHSFSEGGAATSVQEPPVESVEADCPF